MPLPNNDPHTPPAQDGLNPVAISTFADEICGGDHEIITELLETYFVSTRGLLVDMAVAHKTCRFQELRLAAHSLKSSCRIFGAEWLAVNCERLETLASQVVVESRDPNLEESRKALELITLIEGQAKHLSTLLHARFDFFVFVDGNEPA